MHTNYAKLAVFTSNKMSYLSINAYMGESMKQILSTLVISLQLLSPAIASDLVVHEWGTFTSFMGSNGELIDGLHHEDEPLPSFVHGLKKEALTRPHAGSNCRVNDKAPCRVIRNLINSHSELFPDAPISSGVTQKMETPVIYFYGNKDTKVNVEINFPQGIITQYYPQASFSYPKLADARELKDSRFVFDLTLLSPEDTQGIPATSANSIWNPARLVPAANVVKTNEGEKEKFIFYRGIGNFPSPLKVTSNLENVLNLENLSKSEVSMAIVLNSDGKVGNSEIVYNLKDKSSVNIPSLYNGIQFNKYILNVKSLIIQALIKKGLFNDEAVAMVDTWEKSYFHTPGIRVLYIVPNDDTEEILPLSIKPTPSEFKRVLVGRIEVMTKSEEEHYLKVIQNNSAPIKPVELFGRFFEPKLRRLEQISPEELKSKIKALL